MKVVRFVALTLRFLVLAYVIWTVVSLLGLTGDGGPAITRVTNALEGPIGLCVSLAAAWFLTHRVVGSQEDSPGEDQRTF